MMLTKRNSPRKLRTAFATFLLLVVSLRAQSDHGSAIYDFCVHHQGQQVGDGICQSLVDAALRSAGLTCNPAHGLGREVWRISSTPAGVVISGDFRKVLPGDIIYFHDIAPDRNMHRESLRRERPLDNHVGVVDRLTLDGVRYFNQNSGHQQSVRSDYFAFANGLDMVDYVAIYRP
jgi:hypothetical protein